LVGGVLGDNAGNGHLRVTQRHHRRQADNLHADDDGAAANGQVLLIDETL
jgi:hypothetical protein